MAIYEFDTILTIEAEDENSALYAYDQIRNSVWLNDAYCLDWKEVAN